MQFLIYMEDSHKRQCWCCSHWQVKLVNSITRCAWEKSTVLHDVTSCLLICVSQDEQARHRSFLDMGSPRSTTVTPFPFRTGSFWITSMKNSAMTGQWSDATPPHDQLSGIQGLVRPSLTTKQWPARTSEQI